MYHGLADFLDHANVHQHTKDAKSHCDGPHKGQSLRLGSYVPKLKQGFIHVPGRQVSDILYGERYKCGNQKTCSCIISIDVEVAAETATCKALTYGEHSEECKRKPKRQRTEPLSDGVKEILDYTSHHFAPSEAWAILRQGNGFDEVNLPGDIVSRVKNLPKKDVWGATLEKVQMYHASIQRKRSHFVLTSMLNLLEKKENKKYVIYHHLQLPNTLSEVAGMKNKFFYPFHVMLSSELLSAQHEGTKCSEFFDVTGMKEKYEGLFHSAILGLDATYCSDGIKKSCILGLVLVRKDTHTTVPLAYDYAPSESSEYVASFLAKIFAKIADLLGLPSWIPAQIIIDKHDGLRLALEEFSSEVNIVLCHFHMYRAIACQIRTISGLYHLPMHPVINGERYPFPETKEAQQVMAAFKLVRLARTKEEFEGRKAGFLLTTLPQLFRHDEGCLKVSKYFLDHWFDDTWLKTWCHFLLRDSASNDLNVSTNNNIESSWRVLSKTLTSKLVNDGSGSWGNKDTPLTPIKVLNGLFNFLEQSDFRFMQREVEGAARRKMNPFVRRYADLRIELKTLLEQNRVVGDQVNDNTYSITIAGENQEMSRTELTTVAEETHCHCAEFVLRNGQPCKHWFLRYLMVKDPPKFDKARFVQYQKLLAAAYGEQAGIIDMEKEFSPLLQQYEHAQVRANVTVPATSTRTAAISWLPDIQEGIWPLNAPGRTYNTCVYNSFFVAMFAALQFIGIPFPSVVPPVSSDGSIAAKMARIRHHLEERDWKGMYQSWSTELLTSSGNLATTLESLYDHLQDEGDVLASGFCYTNECTRTECAMHTTVRGIWAKSRTWKHVILLPPLEDDNVSDVLSMARHGVCQGRCGDNSVIDIGSSGGCSGFIKYRLNTENAHVGPIFLVHCPAYVQKASEDGGDVWNLVNTATFKGVTTEAVTKQVVAIISVVRNTSAKVDHQVAYFRKGRVWYRFDDMNVRHRVQRVEYPPLNTQRNEYVQLFLYA